MRPKLRRCKITGDVLVDIPDRFTTYDERLEYFIKFLEKHEILVEPPVKFYHSPERFAYVGYAKEKKDER